MASSDCVFSSSTGSGPSEEKTDSIRALNDRIKSSLPANHLAINLAGRIRLGIRGALGNLIDKNRENLVSTFVPDGRLVSSRAAWRPPFSLLVIVSSLLSRHILTGTSVAPLAILTQTNPREHPATVQ